MKKYDFTGETKIVDGVELKQIVRLKDNVIGGWIEKEENLSQERDCFVFNNAVVYGSARIINNARIFSNAKIYGNAVVSGDALICGDSKVYDDAIIYGKPIIFHGEIIGEVQISFDDISFYKSVNTRLVTVITKDNKVLFNVGCQKLISKEEFTRRIHEEEGGLKENPHRKFYLKILELY